MGEKYFIDTKIQLLNQLLTRQKEVGIGIPGLGESDIVSSNIIISGEPGSGKSVLATQLAQRMHCRQDIILNEKSYKKQIKPFCMYFSFTQSWKNVRYCITSFQDSESNKGNETNLPMMLSPSNLIITQGANGLNLLQRYLIDTFNFLRSPLDDKVDKIITKEQLKNLYEKLKKNHIWNLREMDLPTETNEGDYSYLPIIFIDPLNFFFGMEDSRNTLSKLFSLSSLWQWPFIFILEYDCNRVDPNFVGLVGSAEFEADYLIELSKHHKRHFYRFIEIKKNRHSSPIYGFQMFKISSRNHALSQIDNRKGFLIYPSIHFSLSKTMHRSDQSENRKSSGISHLDDIILGTSDPDNRKNALPQDSFILVTGKKGGHKLTVAYNILLGGLRPGGTEANSCNKYPSLFNMESIQNGLITENKMWNNFFLPNSFLIINDNLNFLFKTGNNSNDLRSLNGISKWLFTIRPFLNGLFTTEGINDWDKFHGACKTLNCNIPELSDNSDTKNEIINIINNHLKDKQIYDNGFLFKHPTKQFDEKSEKPKENDFQEVNRLLLETIYPNKIANTQEYEFAPVMLINLEEEKSLDFKRIARACGPGMIHGCREYNANNSAFYKILSEVPLKVKRAGEAAGDKMRIIHHIISILEYDPPRIADVIEVALKPGFLSVEECLFVFDKLTDKYKPSRVLLNNAPLLGLRFPELSKEPLLFPAIISLMRNKNVMFIVIDVPGSGSDDKLSYGLQAMADYVVSMSVRERVSDPDDKKIFLSGNNVILIKDFIAGDSTWAEMVVSNVRGKNYSRQIRNVSVVTCAEKCKTEICKNCDGEHALIMPNCEVPQTSGISILQSRGGRL